MGFSLKKAYLLVYNGAMCAGWMTILLKTVRHYMDKGTADTLYPVIAPLLVVCQTGAIAEVVHAMLGLVRSPVGTTFLQVLSRLLVLYGAIEIGDSPARTSPIFTQMITAWSLSEIIRYSFYVLKLFDVELKPITWLRYSAFMVLYPLGITGEIGCLYKAFPFIAEHKPYTVEMPNKMNVSFSWYNAVCFMLLCVYPYGSYVMYSYMLSQRRKVLSRSASVAASAAKSK